MSDAAEDAWFVLGCLGWAPPSEQPPDQATALRVVTEDGDIVDAVRADEDFWTLDGNRIRILAWWRPTTKRRCPDCVDGGACLPGGCGVAGCTRCGKPCPTCNGSCEVPRLQPETT